MEIYLFLEFNFNISNNTRGTNELFFCKIIHSLLEALKQVEWALTRFINRKINTENLFSSNKTQVKSKSGLDLSLQSYQNFINFKYLFPLNEPDHEKMIFNNIKVSNNFKFLWKTSRKTYFVYKWIYLIILLKNLLMIYKR
ncbi:hypothetical protein BpHYR1_031366 [Brachionus plicatilis]|uniref:Uncharacterized protein n=1 Tax=Brachionus plicatilis TaxID=10195 RepID=A0A3M7SZ99_BRAPC|nr:hypothetical protein BpHYR1_031366 [Brachionus plicatilis]